MRKFKKQDQLVMMVGQNSASNQVLRWKQSIYIFVGKAVVNVLPIFVFVDICTQKFWRFISTMSGFWFFFNHSLQLFLLKFDYKRDSVLLNKAQYFDPFTPGVH